MARGLLKYNASISLNSSGPGGTSGAHQCSNTLFQPLVYSHGTLTVVNDMGHIWSDKAIASRG